jgi:trehalose 6-phosphate synthase
VPALRDRAPLAGGLAVGLREAVAGRETLWFGWSGRTVAGAQPTQPHVARSGRMIAATLDLSEASYRGYYRGFANATLWPLLHWRLGLTMFSRDDFDSYMAVNETFATALAPLLRPDDTIWVHDYHLIPLGAALRRLGVAGRIGFFLHVPFPPPRMFAALPRADRLLAALPAYDLIGLQTQEDAANLTAALADAGVGKAGGGPPRGRAFPIGIDPEAFAAAARREAAGADVSRLHDSLAGRALILGVDRLDYTKGLPQRFRGFQRLLERFPARRAQVTFLQIAPVSRGDVAEYRSLRKELDELASQLNGAFAEFDAFPLRFLTRAMARPTLAGAYRLARVGLVTPLRDGMNLVAKEYVAAQASEDPGVLVLSRFAGAAAQLDGALVVNPYDPDEIAEAVDQALAMSLEERQERWHSMAQGVWQGTAAQWGQDFLAALEASGVAGRGRAPGALPGPGGGVIRVAAPHG